MKKTLFFIVLLTFFISCSNKKHTPFKIGVIADCQYCNCEVKMDRYYKKSSKRLKEAVSNFNNDTLIYTIHLGDFIDKDFKSLDSILPTWKKLKSKSYHVLGNHDFDVEDQLKKEVLKKLNVKERYYSFHQNNWRFIILDGNDLSIHGALTETKKKQTDSLFKLLKNKELPYLKKWNGAFSNKQLKWIKKELDLAVQKKQKVGFYCHFPIYPIDYHNIWNRDQFIKLIKPYKNVKLFFNGHNHAGAYQFVNNVHYVTFKGMVDTQNTSAFAKVKFNKDTVFIQGYDREISRKLVIK